MFFPEIEFHGIECDFVREFSNAAIISCCDFSLRVGVAVRIKVMIYDKSADLVINSIDDIVTATKDLNLKSFYSLSILEIPCLNLESLGGWLFNIDGFRKAHEAVNKVLFGFT
jgi:hypothetical protein